MSEASETKEAAPKKVKIKLLRDCLIGPAAEIIKAGNIVEVTAAEAAEFCDKSFTGYAPYYGYQPEMLIEDGQPNPLARKDIVRAVRVK